MKHFCREQGTLCYSVNGENVCPNRIRVTVNGEFLHYINPFQFLDSPEWDSLRPSEEGVFQVCRIKTRKILEYPVLVISQVFYFSSLFFQVTLRADGRCTYVAWRRKKLYLLFAKHRYIAKIFALVVRNDIADKLYSLNDRALDAHGFRYDLRLPNFCHTSQAQLEKPHNS